MARWPGANGVWIAADTWGNPERPLVLLMHGGGQTRHAWRETGVVLAAQGYFVVSFDARGHGDSDWASDSDYEPAVMVDDLRAVMKAVHKDSAILVGASMGGITGLLAAADPAIDIRALVLVDVAPKVEPEGVEKIRAFMSKHLSGFETLEEVAQAIHEYQPHRPRIESLDGLAKNLRMGPRGRYYWHWDPRFLTTRVVNAEHHHGQLEAAARTLSIPVLLVRGGLSDVVSEEGAQQFLALCPQAEYVNVEGAAHMVVGDQNDTFALAVTDFLHRAATGS